MSEPADESPKPPSPPAVPPPAAEPPSSEPKRRWTRYKLPVNRKDRAVRSAPLPSAPAPATDGPPKSNAIRVLLIVAGVLVLIPVVGCLFLWAICSRGLR